MIAKLITYLLACCSLVSAASQFSSELVVSTSSCGVYGCFRVPDRCENLKCDFLAIWNSDGQFTEFTISARVDSPDQNGYYVAIGFSDDTNMKNDSVVSCRLFKNGTFTVESYYNKGPTSPVILNPSQPSIGLSEAKAKNVNGYIVCNFIRKNEFPGQENYFSLNSPWFLMMAKGGLKDESEKMSKHSSRVVSSAEINFLGTQESVAGNNDAYAKSHGILMIIAWIWLSSIGIFMSRYFKFIFPRTKLLGGDFWFFAHRSLMVVTVLLTLISFVLILVYKRWSWINPAFTINFTHSIVGIVTIGIVFFQPIFAIFRPDKDAPNRYIFNISHRFIGFLIYILSMIAVISGLIHFLDNNLWVVLFGWFVWIVIALVFFEAINDTIAKNRIKLEKSIKSGVMEEADAGLNIRRFEGYKSKFLILHIIVAVAFAVALSYLVAIE